MVDSNENPGYSPAGPTDRNGRAQEIEDWNVDDARLQAGKEGVDMTEDHLKVLFFLRDYYVEHGWPRQTHELAHILDREFRELGGNKYLHQLFPDGPVAQGSRLAGLPEPAYAVDESFGTTL